MWRISLSFPFFVGAGFPALLELAGFLKKIPDAVNLKESITSTTRTEESKKRTKTRRKHFFVSLDDSSSHFYTRRHHHHRIQPGGLSQMILFGLVQIVFPFCLYVQPSVSPPFISECRAMDRADLYTPANNIMSRKGLTE
jgi:hypothetical protein